MVKNLVFQFSDLPFEGADLHIEESFAGVSETTADDPELNKTFSNPIFLSGTVTPVGSKLDVRGHFKTIVEEVCDRCTKSFDVPIQGDLSTFLMPRSQFSDHDKPGGKVIHGPKRDHRKSRHHSASKAPVLSDAEGEHEDVSFGAFDGEKVDLRGLLREQLILALPMSNLCDANCPGLCLRCGENIARKDCKCAEGPLSLEAPAEVEAPISALGQALGSKLQQKQNKQG